MNKILKLRKQLASFVLVAIMICTIFPMESKAAGNTGQAYAKQNLNVLDAPHGNSIGTIYAQEGFSIVNNSGDYMYVNYSTSKGSKSGYVQTGGGTYIVVIGSKCGQVINTTNVWYGPDANKYQLFGTVYAGEYVSVLESTGYWLYIEYNTTSGRKCGYVPQQNIKRPEASYQRIMLDDTQTLDYLDKHFDVRSGPTTQYPIVGSVGPEFVDRVSKTEQFGKTVWYIAYNVPGAKMKSGYVMW